MNKTVLRYLLAIELISFNFNNEYISIMLQIYKKEINYIIFLSKYLPFNIILIQKYHLLLRNQTSFQI